MDYHVNPLKYSKHYIHDKPGSILHGIIAESWPRSVGIHNLRDYERQEHHLAQGEEELRNYGSGERAHPSFLSLRVRRE